MVHIEKSDLMYFLDEFIRSFTCSANITLTTGKNEKHFSNVPIDNLAKNSVIVWLMDRINNTLNFVIEFEIYTAECVLESCSRYDDGVFFDTGDRTFLLAKLFQEI
jgi:hypothetical protein